MRRLALAGLIVASALSLPAGAGAWPGATAFKGAPARTEMWSIATRHGSPSPGRPLGTLQNEPRGHHLRRHYLRNNPPPSRVGPRVPGWAWIAPAWRWNGFRWIWIPGYWIPGR